MSGLSDNLVLDIKGGVSETTTSGEAIIYEKKNTDISNQQLTVKKDTESEYYLINNQDSN